MKILITGNMGYVGSAVVSHFRKKFPSAIIIGFDTGYFANRLTNATVLPECLLDMQIFGDIRNFDPILLTGVNTVIHLAAISNDPMGTMFENVTMDVNYKSSIRLAEEAKKAGVNNFIFASSCSVYGAGGADAKTETDSLNPLTAYAKSKISTEEDLKILADKSFTVTCLRFATACGNSSRLRLDLVLNDFVAGALSGGIIQILSDGSPWRPLIHINDMARAMEWALERKISDSVNFLTVNAGSNVWNYQIYELAQYVAKAIPGTRISVNNNAPPDKRSYKVNFNLFQDIAPNHQPVYTVEYTIKELCQALKTLHFNDPDFQYSNLIRLKSLNKLKELGLINDDLFWIKKKKSKIELAETMS